MLFLDILSETGRSTLIPISSLILMISESMPFGIILNLVAELGQLCNVDLRFSNVWRGLGVAGNCKYESAH